jgi:hypothetical protein
MPVDERFTIRSYRQGDEKGILELFARSFPHAPRSLDHFRWKYVDNPAGGLRISLALEPTGDVVGHYAGYPVVFRKARRDALAHQIGDTMTDASIRHIGRGPTGILGRTALHFYDHFCAGQVAFNYGFNVANIQKFSLRFLRSDRVEPVTYRVAPSPLPLQKGERWLQGYSFELLRETGAELDSFFSRVEGSYDFLVKRDSRYLAWRYFATPDRQYHFAAVRKWGHLVGWIAYRIEGGRFLWGDALFDPRFPEAVSLTLRHVVPQYRVETIEAWFPPRPLWFHRLLIEAGFEERSEPQDLSLMCVPFVWTDAVRAMRESLYYSWGDSDLF